MSTRIDPAARERCLLDVEALLAADAPLRERLQTTADLIGSRLDVQRVVIYGVGQARDASVRVRVDWSAPERLHLEEWISAVPLVSDAPTQSFLAVSEPRGVRCPSDCSVSLPDCALRGACASIIQPLRLGTARYGSLAIHDLTGTKWGDDHVLLVTNLARRIALEIAIARHAFVTDELDAQRAGIAATVLHQVATPVTIIGGVIDQLGRGSDQSSELLSMAAAEVGRLARLCDDLALIADGAASNRTEDIARCDVVATVARCVKAAQDQYGPASKIELTIDDPISTAACDSGDLDRMLGRIIDNAVLYAGKRARIEISCWSDGGHAFVRVRDDGDGLTAAQAETLGEPFSRLDPGMRSQSGGNGLSLAIGRQLARGYGGDLQIEPRTDAPGAQVTIVLPAAQHEW